MEPADRSQAVAEAVRLTVAIQAIDGTESMTGCPETTRDEEDRPSHFIEVMRLTITNGGSDSVTSSRITFLGVSQDGSESAPCARHFKDVGAGQAVDFTLWFVLPYRGEGTTPLIDEAVVLVDGQEAARDLYEKPVDSTAKAPAGL